MIHAKMLNYEDRISDNGLARQEVLDQLCQAIQYKNSEGYRDLYIHNWLLGTTINKIELNVLENYGYKIKLDKFSSDYLLSW